MPDDSKLETIPVGSLGIIAQRALYLSERRSILIS